MSSNFTLRDPNAILAHEHDEKNDAKRVILVGTDMSSMTESIKSSISDGLKDLKIEIPSQNQQQFVTKTEKIEVPVIVKETTVERIEVPVVVKEVEVKTVEVEKVIIIKEPQIVEIPIMQKVTEIVTVDKPVVIEKMVQQDMGFTKSLLIVQTIAIIGLVIGLILK